MNLTTLLAEWIIEFKSKALEPEYREIACRHMTDTLACIICGMKEKTPETMFSYLVKKKDVQGIPVLGIPGVKVAEEDAALYYGICAHVCDFDNLSKNFNGHPGTVILPVVLALGTRKRAAGEGLIRAYIAGTETAAAIGKAFSGTKMKAGWNPTTVLGIFGAVAAGAILMDLNVEECKEALGIAVGEASGLKVNYGSAAKDLAVGRTSSKAIFSLKMAKMGLYAADDPLGQDEGLFHILADDFDNIGFEKMLAEWTSDFFCPGIIMKPYPSCRGVHNGIDGALAIARTNQIQPENIEKVVCRVQSTVFESNRYPIPKDGVEGKFSLPYCVALALINRKVTPEDFTEDSAITERIRNPMTVDELREKLHHCFFRKLSEEKERALIDTWLNPESICLEILSGLL